jgi:hypothetical protein
MTKVFSANEQEIEPFQAGAESVIDLDQYELAVVAGGSGDVVVC